MWRFAFVAFLIAHGAIHLAIWTPRPKPDAPFDPAHSWLLGSHRSLAMVLAIIAGTVLITSGIGLWSHAAWWRPLGVIGLAGSFTLMVVFFHPWFSFIEGVNAALIIGLVWLAWPSTEMVGA